MFCDETQVEITAGSGGDGLCSFRRMKYIPKGGPDGGNGGQGGDVIFLANENLNSLIHLHTQKKFHAENGKSGGTNEKAGRYGEDLILEVPIGTKIIDAITNEEIIDLKNHNQGATIAVGGRGGYGNAHFKSSTRQAPRFAELGEPGETRLLKLELELVADVGIIGLPSAGKSTLISVLSDAKPKIGNFPFTTLIPNLGVARIDNKDSLVFCDIPGLIEGAHEGKGLGDLFLRHISRNLVLIHLVSVESEDPIKDIKIIRNELTKFDPKLTQIPCILAISKIDLLDGSDNETAKLLVKELKNNLQKAFPKFTIMAVSAIKQEGTNKMLKKAFEMTQKTKIANKEQSSHTSEERIILKPHLDIKFSKRFEIEIINEHRYVIHGPRIEQIAVMTDITNHEALFRLRDVMRKMGIERELLRIGASNGDRIIFGEQNREIDFQPALKRNTRKLGNL